MQAQIESLKKKVKRIRRELEVVQQELETMENDLTRPSNNGETISSTSISITDPDKIRLVSDEELYQMMLKDGVDPKDCAGSQGIKEMREE